VPATSEAVQGQESGDGVAGPGSATDFPWELGGMGLSPWVNSLSKGVTVTVGK